MDQNQPPNPSGVPSPSPAAQPPRAPRKSWNPLVVILVLSAAFFFVFLAISGALFVSRGPGYKTAHVGGESFFGQDQVAVVELNGVINDSKKIIRTLKTFEEDSNIKAVVLRLNSPGGAVAPSQEIYEEVRNYKKPIIASMGSVAASGAYYVACGAKKIFANPGTITGSIGVIMEFVNLSKLYAWAKVQRYSIKTGKFKDAGAEYRELTPEERTLFQNMIDDVLSQFKQAVSTGRKIPLQQVTAIADGRVFSGSQAKREKLVDELGSLQDAIKDAAKMAGIKGKPEVVYPVKPHRSLIDLLMNQGKDDDSESETGQTHATFVGELARLITGRTTESLGVLSPGIYWLWTGQ